MTPSPSDSSAVAAPEAVPNQVSVTDYLSTIWNRRILFIPVLLSVTTLTLLGLLRMKPLYEATATVLVDNETKTAFDIEPETNENTSDLGLLNTQRDLFTTNDLLYFSLNNSPLKDNPIYQNAGLKALSVLNKRIKVVTSKDSWIINLSLRDEDSDRAKSGLQTLLDGFLAKQIERASNRAKLALTFMSQSVAEQQNRVEEIRNKVQAFRSDRNVLGSDPDHNYLSDRLDALDTEQVDLDRQVAASKSVLDQFSAIDHQDKDSYLQAMLRIDDIASNPTVLDEERQLNDLLDQQIQLGQKYLDRHPQMITLKEQISFKRNQLAESVAVARATSEATHQRLILQSNSLTDSITKQEHELNEYRRNLLSLEVLDQELKSREDLLDQLLQRQGEEEVESRLNSNIVQVVDPVRCDGDPVNIKIGLFSAAALALGLGIATAAAMLAEALDKRLRGTSGLQKLTKLPILGQIPFISKISKPGNENTPSNFDEAFRMLRSAIRLLIRQNASSKVIVVTSSAPGEGKSTISVHLAVTMATTASRVLLIDADMRRPSLHDLLNMTCDSGLSFRLIGAEKNAPMPTKFPNLDFLGVGVRPPNPSELLLGKALPDLLAEMRTKYDYIIIDTPPVGLVSDAISVAEFSDYIILVVRDRYTSTLSLQGALARMHPLIGKIIGVVFNADRMTDSKYYYGGYYYQAPVKE